MVEVRKGAGYQDDWRRDRIESERALSELESDAEREDELLSFEESLERSRNKARLDRGGRCDVHHRALSYREWRVNGGKGCLWCLYGSQEAYAAHLDSLDLGRDGRRKRQGGMKTIA